MNDEFKVYQGPALYAWNSAVFRDNDWTSLGKINQSSKEEDVLKVGRFGLGFQSVFHITGMLIIYMHMGMCNNNNIRSRCVMIISMYVVLMQKQ